MITSVSEPWRWRDCRSCDLRYACGQFGSDVDWVRIISGISAGWHMSFVQQDLFCPGECGYHLFRIPAIIATQSGNLLAFCEGRKNNHFDAGQIDLCMKRSFDLGRTWEPVRIIASDGRDTMGNPCPLVDQETGTIWMAFCRNYREDRSKAIMDRTARGTRTCWMMHSHDDGETWSDPTNMTARVKKSDWTGYGTGPGVGIQLRDGRLLVPCYHGVAETKIYESHVIYSDNHGQTWHIGGSVGPHCSESAVVELADGTILLNMRDETLPRAVARGEIGLDDRGRPILPGGGSGFCRAHAISQDRGMTWAAKQSARGLTDTVCQASILRYTEEATQGKSHILFANPSSLETKPVSDGYPGGRQRKQMTIRLSDDEAKTWPIAKTINPGFAAYSCLVQLPDARIGCFYEAELPTSGRGKLMFATVSLDWLTNGEDDGMS